MILVSAALLLLQTIVEQRLIVQRSGVLVVPFVGSAFEMAAPFTFVSSFGGVDASASDECVPLAVSGMAGKVFEAVAMSFYNLNFMSRELDKLRGFGLQP